MFANHIVAQCIQYINP